MTSDVYSPEAFLSWLDERPRDERYNYFDVCGCAYAMYLDDKDIPFKTVSGFCITHVDNTTREIDADIVEGLTDSPWTMGDLADRIRSSMDEHRKDGEKEKSPGRE